jgi:PhnB protein
MNSVSTYLFFDGNCAEAMRFYERILGGKLDLLTHADSPEAGQTPPGMENRIMHARLSFDGGMLMASDDMIGADYKGMHGFRISVMLDSPDEATRIFDALAEGGKVAMPMGPTFWSKAFGMVDDRFGTPWMVNGGPIMQ